MSNTLQLLIDLIERPSVTPEDAGCMDLLVERLEKQGFTAEFMDFDDTRNILIRHGQTAPLFTFLGHTDVVPPGPLEQWHSDPFKAEIREGKLYGRGAADMKSGIACFVTAAERFVERYPNHPGSLGILLTSDEEGIATNGIVKVVEQMEARQEKITWCLVGEPSSLEKTGDIIKVGRRGSLCAEIIVKGIQGHVAYPHCALNPIHKFAPALAKLSEEIWDQGNAFFPPTSFQVSNINSGTGADNVIPGQLKALFNFRFSTESTVDQLKARTQAILDEFALDYELNWRLSGLPFLTSAGKLKSAVHQAIEKVTGYLPQDDTGGGTSDGRFIAPTGAQVVELGPLNASIHKINEHVALEELETLSNIYEQILVNLLAN